MSEPNLEQAKRFADLAAELAIEMTDRYTSYLRLCDVNGQEPKDHEVYFLEEADQTDLHHIRTTMLAYAIEMGYITPARFE